MNDDILTFLHREYDHFNNDGGGDYEVILTAANEIERLRYERREWFLVARQLRDSLMMTREIDDALNDYLRTRGRLEDPRDCFEEADSE